MLNIELQSIQELKKVKLEILKDTELIDILQFKYDYITCIIEEEFSNFYKDLETVRNSDIDKAINFISDSLEKYSPATIYNTIYSKYDNGLIIPITDLLQKYQNNSMTIEVFMYNLLQLSHIDLDNVKYALKDCVNINKIYSIPINMKYSNVKNKYKIKENLLKRVYKINDEIYGLIKTDIFELLAELLHSIAVSLEELLMNIDLNPKEDISVEPIKESKKYKSCIKQFKEYNKLLEDNGYTYARQKGSHRVFTKKGHSIVIPQHKLGKGLSLKIDKEITKLERELANQ